MPSLSINTSHTSICSHSDENPETTALGPEGVATSHPEFLRRRGARSENRASSCILRVGLRRTPRSSKIGSHALPYTVRIDEPS